MRFFTHEINSRNDDRVFELIDIHGLGGYGFFWVILEELYGSEDTGFQIEATNIWMKRLARSLNLTDDRTIIRYFDTLADLGLIDKQLWHERIIYSQGVMDRADAYMEKKAKEAEKKRNQRVQAKSSEACPDSVPRVSLGTESMSQNVPLSYTDPYADPHPHSQANPKTEEKTRSENISQPQTDFFAESDLPAQETLISDLADQNEETPPPTPAPLAVCDSKLKTRRSVLQEDQETFAPFLAIWNRSAPKHWDRYDGLNVSMIDDLKKFVKVHKKESLQIFEEGLLELSADNFIGTTKCDKWRFGSYFTKNKPKKYSDEYKSKHQRRSQQSPLDRPMTPVENKMAHTYSMILEAIA